MQECRAGNYRGNLGGRIVSQLPKLFSSARTKFKLKIEHQPAHVLRTARPQAVGQRLRISLKYPLGPLHEVIMIRIDFPNCLRQSKTDSVPRHHSCCSRLMNQCENSPPRMELPALLAYVADVLRVTARSDYTYCGYSLAFFNSSKLVIPSDDFQCQRNNSCG